LNRYVVDASVGVKWIPLFFSEPLVSKAKQYLERRSAGEIALVVPDLFWPEVTGVLCRAARRGVCKLDEAETALAALQDLHLPTLSSPTIANPALGIAVKYGRSIYDSMYVALAVHLHSQLITADEKLANALAAHLPVIWLGSI
jgi:predicted nucleic acid-binding protein